VLLAMPLFSGPEQIHLKKQSYHHRESLIFNISYKSSISGFITKNLHTLYYQIFFNSKCLIFVLDSHIGLSSSGEAPLPAEGISSSTKHFLFGGSFGFPHSGSNDTGLVNLILIRIRIRSESTPLVRKLKMEKNANEQLKYIYVPVTTEPDLLCPLFHRIY
jgi:hypothetical protein